MEAVSLAEIGIDREELGDRALCVSSSNELCATGI